MSHIYTNTRRITVSTKALGVLIRRVERIRKARRMKAIANGPVHREWAMIRRERNLSKSILLLL